MPNRNVPSSIPAQVLEGDFAGWLKQAMAARRMSQRMVALRTGLNHATVSRLLAGSRDPSLSTALALIQVLDGPIQPLADPETKDDLPQDLAS